ncbi:hypothetical protein NDI45_20370 [Leptolyngbya sp. GB1-A1]|uniref:hypothetical protein n=1 Tax=Leptolyngbya sp. GB1-A1 TaxID=2933908 RepID=UPI003299D8D8
MRISILSIVATLATAPLLRTMPAQAQSVPNLHQGMSYAQARQLILDAGWSPSYNVQALNTFGLSSRVTYFQRLGYTEIVDCAGTGMGLCRFEFYGDQGQTLAVSVGQGTQTNVVYQWWVEE